MRRVRILSTLGSLAVALLVLAPDALARANAGEGFYGPTTDRTITYAMYLVIIFFPTIIILFSVIQWRLDRRKHARMAATRRRAASADWRGGW
jgi:peptidoglycan biosynthesis protein MviN/MurJ (putative lipid II flippase)